MGSGCASGMLALLILGTAAHRLDEALGVRVGVEVGAVATSVKAVAKDQERSAAGCSEEVCCMGLQVACQACARCISEEEFCLGCLTGDIDSPDVCVQCDLALPATLHPGILPVLIDAAPSPSPPATACQQAMASSGSMMGAYVPQCDEEDGSYTPIQCHGSTGECWCVDGAGLELRLTRATGTLPNCPTTPCQVASHVAVSSGLLGAARPSCDEDGAYTPIQCHSSIGHCWCVDAAGVEVEGTRRTDHTAPECAAAAAEVTPCQAAAAAVPSGRIGAYTPQCDEDGGYAAMQCHGSTGHCWCVDEGGAEVDATRAGPTDERPRCERVSSRSEASQEEGTRAANSLVCERGDCFCTDAEGHVRPETRVREGRSPEPDCRPPAHAADDDRHHWSTMLPGVVRDSASTCGSVVASAIIATATSLFALGL